MSTVLITGATGGLGSAVTKTFVENKWKVIATVNPTSDVFNDSPSIQYIKCDVTNHISVEKSFERINELDAVVHLVGGIEAGTMIEDTTINVFEKMISLNLRSTFNLLHYAMPLLKKNSGSVVTVGAKDVLHPAQKRSTYHASKAGVVALTLAAAEEGKAFGVRANVIIPSIIRTAANLEWATNGEEQKWLTPESISDTIYFLCSDNNSTINGAVIPMLA